MKKRLLRGAKRATAFLLAVTLFTTSYDTSYVFASEVPSSEAETSIPSSEPEAPIPSSGSETPVPSSGSETPIPSSGSEASTPSSGSETTKPSESQKSEDSSKTPSQEKESENNKKLLASPKKALRAAPAPVAVSYTINGKNLVGQSVSVEYGETVTIALTNLPEGAKGAEIYYKKGDEEYSQYNAPLTNLAPAKYYLGYTYETADDESVENLDFNTVYFEVVKAPLPKPTNLAWDSDMTTAKWDAVTKDKFGKGTDVTNRYEVKLYKAGVSEALFVDSVAGTATSYDFWPEIKDSSKEVFGPGSYSFTVEAQPKDTAHYVGSGESDKSTSTNVVKVSLDPKKGIRTASVSDADKYETIFDFLLVAGSNTYSNRNINATAQSGWSFKEWTTAAAGITFGNAGTAATNIVISNDYAAGSEITVNATATETEAPVINLYQAGTGDDKGKLVAKAIDSKSGLVGYCFSTKTRDQLTDEDFTAVALTNEEKDFSYVPDKSGAFYFYAKDAEGNIAVSTSSIAVSKIILNGYYKNNSKSQKTFWHIGSEKFDLPSLEDTADDATPHRKGYEFDGWYKNQDFSGDKAVSLTTNSASDVNLYAKWNFTTPTWEKALTATEKTYTGEDIELSVKAAGNTADISYEWYKKNSEGTFEKITSAATNKLTVKNVSDSGEYRVDAIVSYEDDNGDPQTEKLKGTPVVITINKAPLSVKATAKTVNYLDDAPETYAYTYEGLVGDDIVESAGEPDNTKAAEGVFNTKGQFTCNYKKGDEVKSEGYEIKLKAGDKFEADNYSITVVPAKLTVAPKAVSDSSVTLTIDPDSYTYTGSEINPTFTIKDSVLASLGGEDNGIISASNYEVSCDEKTIVGEHTLTLTFKGNYTGTKSHTFTITENDSYNPIVSLADWTYGQTAKTPSTSGVPFDVPTLTYYYVEDAAGTINSVAATDAWTTTQPVNAGDYKVYVKVSDPNGNYATKNSEPATFKINKRKIYIEADSQTWEYDGWAHSDHGYKLLDADNNEIEEAYVFIDSHESFQYIKVDGSITNVTLNDKGENIGVPNVVSYQLSSVTNADNYDIEPINGILKITPIQITSPAGLAWDISNPGTASWVAIVKKQLNVKYEVELYKHTAGGDTKITTVTTDEGATSYNFRETIHNNISDGTDASFFFKVKTIPASGEAKEDYYASGYSEKSDDLHTVTIELSKKNIGKPEGADQPGLKSISFRDYPDHNSVTLVSGESIVINAETNEGYSFHEDAFGAVDRTNDKYFDYSNKDNGSTYQTTLTVNDKLTASLPKVLVTASTFDEKPYVTDFSAVNMPDAGYKGVKVTFTANDSIGIKSYGIVKGKLEEVTDAYTGEKSTHFVPDSGAKYAHVNATLVEGNYPKSVQAEFVISAPGIYAAAYNDTAGEDSHYYYSYSTVFTVYEVSFDKGSSDDAIHTMPNVYKLANTSITLPTCTFTYDGNTFKNWSGENTGSTTDGAEYKANASDKLTAQWSNDQYPYTIEYYYMNTEGGYDVEPDETASFIGHYNDTINYNDESVQKTKANYSLDAAPYADYVSSIRLTSSGKVLKVYYKTGKYNITYKYTMPGESEETQDSDEFYYGQAVTERAKPTAEGYDFIGWSYEGTGSTPLSMPAHDIVATGRFEARNANYQVVYHMETLGNGATKTGKYTIDPKRTETFNAKHDDEITAHCNEYLSADSKDFVADQIDGFTLAGIKMSKGAAIDAGVSEGDLPTGLATDTVKGTVKENTEEKLVINLYYTRNVYNLYIDVWDTNREIEEHRIYRRTVSRQYEESLDLTSYEKDETYLADDFPKDDSNNKFTMPSGYKFASYTDYSTGLRPSKMPAGDVTVTRDVIRDDKAKYNIEIYFETSEVGQYEKVSELEMEAGVDATVHIGTDDPSKDNATNCYVNYETIVKTVQNYDYYTYVDKTKLSDTDPLKNEIVIEGTAVKDEANPLVLKVYYERKETEATIIYYCRPKTESKDTEIAKTTIKGKWGTTYDVNPVALFDANTSADWTSSAITNLKKEQAITLTKNPDTEKVPGSDSTALAYDFRNNNYLVSYNGFHRYIGDAGVTWNWPSQTMTTIGTGDTYKWGSKDSGLNDVIRCTFGVPYNTNNSYMYVHYNQIDTKEDFYLDFVISKAAKNSDNIGLYRRTDKEGNAYANTPIYYEYAVGGGEKQKLPLRVMNACAIISDAGKTMNTKDAVAEYPAANATGRHYDYSDKTKVNSGFTYIDGEYYYYNGSGSLTDSTPCIYIADFTDRFIPGAYTSYSHKEVGGKTTPDYQQVLDFLNEYKNDHKDSESVDLYDESYESLNVYNSSWGGTYVTGNSQTLTYSYYYKEQCAITYSFSGRLCSNHKYTYGSTVSKSDIGCTHAATPLEGYDIVWYLDYQFTKPIPDAGLKMNQNRTVYGRYEKSVIHNKEYVYYELADPITIDENTYDYVTEDNLEAIKTRLGDRLTSSTDTITVNVGTSEKPNNKEAKITTYKVDGAVVLVMAERPSTTYTELYLRKDAENKSYEEFYGKDGFYFDETNNDNRSYGYVNTIPISLRVFFARDKYTIKINNGISETDNPEYKTLSVDQHIIIADPERPGYTFAGYEWKKTTGEAYTPVILSGETTPRMPAFDLEATAKWEEADFDHFVNHYFQTKDRKYNTGFNLEGAYFKEEEKTFNGKSGTAYYYGAEGNITGVRFVVKSADVVVATYLFAGNMTEDNLVKAVTKATSRTNAEILANTSAISGLKMHEYAYTAYKSGATIRTCAATDSYKAEYGMDISCYYQRTADCIIRLRSAVLAEGDGETGAIATEGVITTGAGQYSYGDRPTLEALLASGYVFLGWYKASDVLKDYPGDGTKDLSEYAFIDDLRTSITGESPSIYPASTDKKYIHPELEDSADYVAMVQMSAVVPPTLSITGKTEYVYGYEASADNVLMAVAKVNESDPEAKKTKVTGYQWYEYKDGDWAELSGQTNAIFFFEQDKHAGDYKYKCVVSYERTDTHLSGQIDEEVTVKVAKANFKVTTSKYEGVFDNAPHSIGFRVDRPSTASGYTVYYSSDEELTEANYNTKGVTTKPEYTHVNSNTDGPCPYTTYYYIHDESGNYNDCSGSQIVNIKPRSIRIKALSQVFEKMYDGHTLVEGEVTDSTHDMYKFSHGRDTYYELVGFLDGDTKSAAYIVGCTAEFNNAHVKDAKNFTVSNLYLVNNDDGHKEYDYTFPASTTLIFSGNITPRLIEISWDEETNLVFNGQKQSPNAHIKAEQTHPIPVEDKDYFDITVLGKQTNVGSYTATAQASIKSGGTCFPSDYTFDVMTKDYNIVKRNIVIKPEDVTSGITYDGTSKTVDAIKVYKDNSSYADENIDTIVSDTEKFIVTAKQQKSYVNAGTYTDMIFAGAKIKSKAGVDLTENFDITYATGTMVIDKAKVRVSGITAEEKYYDGKTDVTIHVGDGDSTLVFTPLYSQGSVKDELSLDSTKITASYDNAAAGTTKVNISIAADALTGRSKDNYELDLVNCQKEATGKINNSTIKVKADSKEIVYGQTPAFTSSYTGIIKEDGSAGVIGDISVTGDVSYKIRPLSSTDDSAWTDYVAGVTAAGQYEIKAVVDSLSTAHFTFSWEADKANSILTVTKRPVVIKASDSPVITKTYDGNKTVAKTDITKTEDYVFDGLSGDAASGLLSGDAAAFDLSGFDAEYDNKDVSSSGKSTRATKVTLSKLSINDSNYKLVKADGSDFASSDVLDIAASITKKDLTLTLADKTITYGTATPNAYVVGTTEDPQKYAISYEGFIDGEDESVLTGSYTITSAYDSNDSTGDNRKVGKYAVTIKKNASFDSDNYNILVNGSAIPVAGFTFTEKLTVTKADLTVTMNDKEMSYKIGLSSGELPTLDYVYSGFKFDDAASGTTVTGSGTTETEKTNLAAMQGYIKDAGGSEQTLSLSLVPANNYKICLKNVPSELTNYNLTVKEGTLKVNKAGLYIDTDKLKTFITSPTKVYDGTTKLDASSISVSDRGALINELKESSKVANEHLMDVDVTYLTTGAGSADPIIVFKDATSGYPDKNVGSDKTLTVSYELSPYLAARYTLLDKTDKVAKGSITPASLEIKAADKTIKYGDASPAFTYTATGLVNSEKIETTSDFSPKAVSYDCSYSNAAGSCSDANTEAGYAITPKGPVNANYAITFTLGKLTVNKAKLTTPNPAWKPDSPGTVSWAAISKIGDVEVAGYIVHLYKDGSEITEACQGSADTPYTGTQADFASAIRNAGGGQYTVAVQAIASKTNNDGNKNVDDSALSAATSALYATNVSLEFAGETTGDYKGVGADEEIDSVSGNPIWLEKDSNKKRGYVVIAGESGYQIGAKLRLATGYSASVTADEGLSISGAATSGVNVSAALSVASGATPAASTKVYVTVAKKAAMITAGLTADKTQETYGFNATAAPVVTCSPALVAEDDIKDLSGYTFSYSWECKSVKLDTNVATKSDTDGNTTSQYKLLDQYNGEYTPVSRYRVYCKITATRNDNGESTTFDAQDLTKTAKPKYSEIKIIQGKYSPTVSLDGWTYGQARKSPVMSNHQGASTAENTTYYYSNNNGSTWQTNPFTDVGTYWIYAHVNATDNFEAADTPKDAANVAKYTITKTKLSDPTNVEHKASATAPYGKLTWNKVDGPKENAGATPSDSAIAVKYALNLSYLPKGKTADSDYVSLGNFETRDLEYDFTSVIKNPGTYKMTVKAVVDEKRSGKDASNCDNSDPVVKTAVLTIGADITSNGTANATGFEKIYDGSPLTLKAEYSDGHTLTYKWMKNGVAYTGYGANTAEISITYVDENASFVCEITSEGQKIYSKAETATIKPRAITVETASASHEYDGNAFTKTDDVVYKLNADGSANGLASNGGLTDVATIDVTGSIIHVSQNDTEASKNTFENLVIKRGEKTVYESGSTTNCYTVTPSYGKLTITPKPVTLGWSHNENGTWTDFTARYSGKERVVSATVSNKATSGGSEDSVNVTAYTGNKATNVGSYEAKATALDNSDYTLTGGSNITKNWSIAAKSLDASVSAKITNADVEKTAEDQSYKFNWHGTFDVADLITPIVLVEDSELESESKALTPGTDYELSGNLNAKKALKSGESYNIKVTLKGNYSGEIDLVWKIVDVTAPDGKVRFSKWDQWWNEVLSTITFGRYTNENITVHVNAKDENNGSGLKSVEYYEFHSTEAKQSMTQEELDALDSSKWTALSGVSADSDYTGNFDISVPNNDTKLVVIYVKVTDNAGHVKYMSTDGLVMETVLPVVSGIDANKTYCISHDFTVTDDYLKTINIYKYVNGTATLKESIALDGAKTKTITLLPDNHKDTCYKIEAIDESSNKTIVDKVTINKNHSYSYTGAGTAKLVATCTVDTCEYYNAVANDKDISVSIAAAGGDYTGLAYTGTTTSSGLFDSLNVDGYVKVGTVGAITYHKVASKNATTGGTTVASAIEAGEYYAQAEVTGADGNKYKIVKAFTISPVSLSKMEFDNAAFTFDGTDKKPAVTVKATVNGSEKTCELTKDYTLKLYKVTKNSEGIDVKTEVTDSKAVGTYEYIATGKGNFTGTVSKTFTVTDMAAPTISGKWSVGGTQKSIENSGKYCGGVTVTVSDDNLTHVKITATGGAVDDTVDEDLTVKTKNYTLKGSTEGTAYTIEATDISDNKTSWTITVWKEHLFTSYSVDMTKSSSGQIHRADCDHACGAKDYIIKPAGEIDWQYDYEYYANDGNIHTGTLNPSERETHAIIKLYQDGKLIATKFMDCDSECGTSSGSPVSRAVKNYEFTSFDPTDPTKDSGASLLSYEDCNGNTHSYELVVDPIIYVHEAGSYDLITTYDVEHKQKLIVPGDLATITYNPHLFDAPWKVTLKNLPEDESGNTIHPTAIYVKTLYAERENAADSDYSIVTQQAGAYTNSVKCSAVAAGDGTYTYSGDFSVWQHIGGSQRSYYHRIQVVGYEYNGVSYDVTEKQLRSICDSDHVNHTTYYVDATDSASGTILYELDNLMPTLIFDMNDGTGKAHKVIFKNINSLGEGGIVTEEELEGIEEPTRSGYKFAGWYTEPSGGSQLEGPVDLKNGCVRVYAKWNATIIPIIIDALPPILTPKAPTPVVAEPEKETPKEAKPTSPSNKNNDKPVTGENVDVPDQVGEKNTGSIKVYVETNETEHGKLEADVPKKKIVIDAIMNTELKKAVDNGEDIEIRVTVDPKHHSVVSADEKNHIESQLKKLETKDRKLVVGKYIDLRLDWRTSSSKWNNVPHTKDNVLVTIDIPKELRQKDRVFYIVYSNGNERAVLEDYDINENTITISTHLFHGTYAIAYEMDGEGCRWHWWVLICAIITLLILILLRVKKETEEAPIEEADVVTSAGRKKKPGNKKHNNARIRVIVFLLGSIISFIFVVIGTCIYDFPIFIIQLLATGGVEISKGIKQKRLEDKQNNN